MELKPGHAKRKSYITRRSREERVETDRNSSKGAEGGAKSPNEEEALGMRGVLVHIKEEFTRRGVMAREVTWVVQGFPAAPSLSHQQTTAGPERVKSRQRELEPVRFLLGRQRKPEPGKAAAELMGLKTTVPSSPSPRRVVRHLGGWWGKGSRPIAPKAGN